MTTNDDDENWFSEVIVPASGSKPPITSQKKKKKWGRQNIISHQKGFAKFHSRLPVQGTRISRGTAQRQLWDVVAATLSFASQAKDVRWELIMVIAPNLLPAPLHYNPWSASNPQTLDQSVSNEGHAISSWHGCNARKLNYGIGNFCRAETGTWTEWLVVVSLPLLRIYGPRSFPRIQSASATSCDTNGHSCVDCVSVLILRVWPVHSSTTTILLHFQGMVWCRKRQRPDRMGN